MDRCLEWCKLYNGWEAKSIDERTAHALFHFFRNWGMKWGRQSSRSAILLINTVEETLNG